MELRITLPVSNPKRSGLANFMGAILTPDCGAWLPVRCELLSPACGRRPARRQGTCRSRDRAWATADRPAERFAEVAEAGIAHFEGRFGDVEFSRLQQLGRPLHPHLAQVLRDGHAHLL